MTKRMIYTALVGIPLVQPGDDVAALICKALEEQGLVLIDGDIVVLAQKVVSKAQDRYVNLNEVEPSDEARKYADLTGKDARYLETVLSESKEVVRYRKDLIIVEHRLGYVMANAGIDESNIEHEEGTHRVLLLPADPDGTCSQLKAELDAKYDADIGIVINDSFGRAWRNGVVGVALGSAGLPSLQSKIGHSDLFGREMRVTEIAVADEIAAAASLIMGQTDEAIPAVHVRGFRSRTTRNPAAALIRQKERDLFR